jgi:hypothetical protein
VITLIRVVPNERWQLVLEFEDVGLRLFRADQLYVRWPHFAYPNVLKHFRFTAEAIWWASGESLSAQELLDRSEAIERSELEFEYLSLGMNNQAPTAAHTSHHVFYVSLAPFSHQPFVLGESIGGGHMELGGSFSFSLAELRAHSGWQDHLRRAGCDWPLVLLEKFEGEQPVLVDALVRIVCGLQNDTPLSTVLDGLPELPADARRLLTLPGISRPDE